MFESLQPCGPKSNLGPLFFEAASKLMRSTRSHIESGAPSVLGLRRQDAGANIREANSPKGEPRTRRVILMYI
jgi:hypothetical protein